MDPNTIENLPSSNECPSPIADAGWSLGAALRESAERWPDALAASDGTAQLSFRELDARCDRVAARLLQVGVKPRDRVVVLGGKDLCTLSAILGVTRAGAVFIPIDPSVPAARLRFYLEDAHPELVIAPAALASVVCESMGDRFLSFAELEQLIADDDGDGLGFTAPAVDSSEVCYVLYTSGSSGFPKGVQIEHRNVFAFFAAHNERANIVAGDRCMNTGPFHFDVAVLDVFLPLSVGAAVFLSPATALPSRLLTTLEQHEITHFYAVGTVLALMTGDGSLLDRFDLSRLRVLQTGAEVCDPQVVNQWLARAPQLTFLNSYGPTEVTVGCVSYVKPEPGTFAAASVPIGRPHAGTSVRLLSSSGALVERTHVVGELLLGGAQVMRGYLNRPLETRRCFVTLGGERYYRSGDLAYWDDDQNLCFVGRADDEVKVDGHRIHLNEIRRVALTHPEVTSVAVGLIKQACGRAELGCVVVLATSTPEPTAQSLLAHFAQQLPARAIPRVLGFAYAIASTPTGKRDEKSAIAALEAAVTRTGERLFVERSAGFTPVLAETRAARSALPSRP